MESLILAHSGGHRPCRHHRDRNCLCRALRRRATRFARVARLARAAACRVRLRAPRRRARGFRRAHRPLRAPEGRRLHDRANALRRRRNAGRNRPARRAHVWWRSRGARASHGCAAARRHGSRPRSDRRGRRDIGRVQHSVFVLADLRHRGQVRLQPDHAQALVHRSREGSADRLPLWDCRLRPSCCG